VENSTGLNGFFGSTAKPKENPWGTSGNHLEIIWKLRNG
jgi:hypothetical protein